MPRKTVLFLLSVCACIWTTRACDDDGDCTSFAQYCDRARTSPTCVACPAECSICTSNSCSGCLNPHVLDEPGMAPFRSRPEFQASNSDQWTFFSAGECSRICPASTYGNTLTGFCSSVTDCAADGLVEQSPPTRIADRVCGEKSESQGKDDDKEDGIDWMFWAMVIGAAVGALFLFCCTYWCCKYGSCCSTVVCCSNNVRNTPDKGRQLPCTPLSLWSPHETYPIRFRQQWHQQCGTQPNLCWQHPQPKRQRHQLRIHVV